MCGPIEKCYVSMVIFIDIWIHVLLARGPNACIISIAYDQVLNFQSVAQNLS